MSQIAAVASEIAPHLSGYQVIVTKSTVPVGTGDWLRGYLRERLDPLGGVRRRLES